jgi:hypothetical protein
MTASRLLMGGTCAIGPVTGTDEDCTGLSEGFTTEGLAIGVVVNTMTLGAPAEIVTVAVTTIGLRLSGLFGLARGDERVIELLTINAPD